MFKVSIVATFLLIAALAVASLAHDTWLIPDRFVVSPDTSMVLNLTSGMAFPALETSIKPERLEHAVCRLAGQNFDVNEFSASAKSLRFKAHLVEAGIATFWVELKPRSLQLTAEQVKEYLDEIDAPKAVRQEWATTKKPRRWREVYIKHSKTFVRVGEAKSDQSWAEPVGMRLEIVPEKDPTHLRRGDELPLRVLKNGSPMVDFPLGVVFEGNSKGRISKTDTEGRVKFRLDQEGRYLIRGTDLRKSSQPAVDWESDFTTLTIKIGTK